VLLHPQTAPKRTIAGCLSLASAGSLGKRWGAQNFVSPFEIFKLPPTVVFSSLIGFCFSMVAYSSNRYLKIKGAVMTPAIETGWQVNKAEFVIAFVYIQHYNDKKFLFLR
jgi:hypothetical protein